MATDARDHFDRTAAGYSVSRAHSASESLRLFKEFAGDRRYGVALDMASVSAPFHILVPHPRHLVFTGRRINKQQNTRRTQNTPRLSKKRGNRSKVVRGSAHVEYYEVRIEGWNQGGGFEAVAGSPLFTKHHDYGVAKVRYVFCNQDFRNGARCGDRVVEDF